jgi:hypothetical protein
MNQMKMTRQLLLTAVVCAFVCAGAHLRAQEPAPAGTGTNTAKFSGTVTDAAGKPVAGATVEYWHYDGNPFLANPLQPEMPEMKKQTAITGTDGAFSFQVSASIGFLLAQKTGLAPAWKSLIPMFNSPRETEGKLVLTPPGTLAGVVMDESNRPVANAEVYVVMAVGDRSHNKGNSLFGKPARDHFSAHTDAAGHFRIENFPANAAAMLAVQSPGKVFHPPEQESFNFEEAGYRVGQEDIKLVVEPAGGVEGKIVVGENNQPPPVVQLMLLPDAPRGFTVEGYTPVKSGTNGVFHFDKVLAGSYRIQVTFGPNNDFGWVAEMVPVTVTAGRTTPAVQVKVVRGALLEATVLGKADHKPQPKVNVIAAMDESQFHGVSDSNGVAKVFVLPGNYQVSAFQQQSRSSGQASATVEAGKTNRVEIEMAEISPGQIPGQIGSAPAIKISGVVHLPGGKPANGVLVQLVGGHQPPGEDLQTDANGKFEVEWNPRQSGGPNDSTTCILVRDAEHNLAVAQDLDEDTTNLDLKLAPGLAFFGRAEAGGKPLTNATAQLVFWTGRSGMWLRGLARTNTPGQYEIPALPPGRKYGVIVSAPGYGQKQIHNLEISSEAGRQELDTVELKLANLKLSGQVLDADDKPVAHCNVGINGEDQPSANARTDRDGRFSFAHVCEGTIRLYASSQHAFGSISVEGGDTNVVLHLGENMNYAPDAKQHKLRGVVTDAGGKPAAGVQVAVFPNNGAHWVKTGTNGEYSLNWSLQSWQLQNGGAMLVLRDPARNLAGTEELPEETTNLNVKLKPALAFSGQVKNADGALLTTAQVGLWLKTGNSYDHLNGPATSPVDAEGRFEINCLPPDAQYLVYASAKGYGKGQHQLQPEYESNRVKLAAFILKHTDRVIAGQVLKDDDKPASGVNVQLSGEDQPDGNMTTDSQGRFHFQVCEGQVRLFANSQSCGFAQATAEAGDTNVVMTLSSQPGNVRQSPNRTSLKDSPLPDLTSVNLAADTAPAGKPVLLCLFDASQRPSRHVIHQLAEQAAALRQRNVILMGVQAAVISDETFNEWKSASPVSFPVGRVTEKSGKSRWASAVPALPWLILADANHRVVAEGFAPDELDAQIKKLTQ